jgi:hypothetical protein
MWAVLMELVFVKILSLDQPLKQINVDVMELWLGQQDLFV